MPEAEKEIPCDRSGNPLHRYGTSDDELSVLGAGTSALFNIPEIVATRQRRSPDNFSGVTK